VTIHSLLNQLEYLDIRLRVEGGKLRFKAPTGAMTDEMKFTINERKPEIIEALTVATPPVERWKLSDENGLSKCKSCGGRIHWGEVESIQDSKTPTGRKPGQGDRKWIPLDPDYVPHSCSGLRRIEHKRGKETAGEWQWISLLTLICRT
jgi:TubC N-terminal docking domain